MRTALKRVGLAVGLILVGLFVGVAGLRTAQIVAPAHAPQPIGQPRGFIGKVTGGDFLGHASGGSGSGDITEVAASTGLTGGSASGVATLEVDFAVTQARVTNTCPAGQAIRAIAADSTVTCEIDDNSGGDVTSVTAGDGVAGGAASGDATVSALGGNNGFYLYDEVLYCSTTGGPLNVTVSGAGAGCIAPTTTTAATRPGVRGLSAGTTATGRAHWVSTSDLEFGSGVTWVFETQVSPQALSDGTNTWTWRGGFCDIITGADCVDGVYFEYDQSADTHWRCKTASNSTRTANNSTVTATVNTYHKLRITLTDDSSALFEIDDVTVCGGAIATNIPTGSARSTFWVPGLVNSTAGSVNTRAMDTSYWKYQARYATPF